MRFDYDYDYDFDFLAVIDDHIIYFIKFVSQAYSYALIFRIVRFFFTNL